MSSDHIPQEWVEAARRAFTGCDGAGLPPLDDHWRAAIAAVAPLIRQAERDEIEAGARTIADLYRGRGESAGDGGVSVGAARVADAIRNRSARLGPPHPHSDAPLEDQELPHRR